jgi:transposase InsO family protein
VDFVRRWSEKTEIRAGHFIEWLDITASKLYDWRERYGKTNEHNGWVPRDYRLEEREKLALIKFHLKNLLEGCRRVTFMMLEGNIHESITEADVEITLQKAMEKYPEARPRIIPDNGHQSIAKDLKESIRISSMTHVRTSPYYPQSNGKIGRWHKPLKRVHPAGHAVIAG